MRCLRFIHCLIFDEQFLHASQVFASFSRINVTKSQCFFQQYFIILSICSGSRFLHWVSCFPLILCLAELRMRNFDIYESFQYVFASDVKQFFGLSPGVMRGCVQDKQFDLVSPISLASLFQPALLNAINSRCCDPVLGF